MNYELVLIVVGSSIFLFLGGLHLYMTFFSNKFRPRNDKAEVEMKNTHMRLTKDTSMWNAWVGFHGSHSIGAMFFGAFNIIIAINFYSVFEESIALITLDSITILFYLFLAKNYWFRIPLTGIAISGLCFIIAFIMILIH